ncbi:MAG: hypothetical protein IPO52_07625 [Gemmatimonadetes bacterium]|nr:hypothetical protein [Gemmatimonadota bacterium]
MTDDTLPALQAEYARLATALATAPSAEQRALIKADIVALFRRAETLIRARHVQGVDPRVGRPLQDAAR